MIETKVLSSGVRLVMEEMPSVRSVAIGIYVKAGAVREDQKYAGISHFVEHMMFKGTAKRSAREIAADIDRIGGQINAFTGKESTCYYVKTVSENYQKGAEVLLDMLEGSLFEKKELDRERKVVMEEIKMGKDSPDDLSHELLMNGLFRDSSLGCSILGTPTSLNRITHRVMSSYVGEEYSRDSIVISAAGHFDPEELAAFFDDKLMALAAERKEKPYIPAEGGPVYRNARKDIEQAHITLGIRTVPLGDERIYPLQILSNILGGSMSSRLFQNIREQKGLAYSVYSGLAAFSKDGYFQIYAGVGKDKIRDAVRGIREELKILAKEPVSLDELESSREQIKASFAFSHENTNTRMMVNGRNLILLGRVLSADEVISAYDKVDIDRLEEVKGILTDLSQYSAACVSGTSADIRSIMEE